MLIDDIRKLVVQNQILDEKRLKRTQNLLRSLSLSQFHFHSLTSIIEKIEEFDVVADRTGMSRFINDPRANDLSPTVLGLLDLLECTGYERLNTMFSSLSEGYTYDLQNEAHHKLITPNHPHVFLFPDRFEIFKLNSNTKQTFRYKDIKDIFITTTIDQRAKGGILNWMIWKNRGYGLNLLLESLFDDIEPKILVIELLNEKSIEIPINSKPSEQFNQAIRDLKSRSSDKFT
jgi:hypothetical protein